MYIIHRSSLSALIITEEFPALHHCVHTVQATGPQDAGGRLKSPLLLSASQIRRVAKRTGESSVGELGSDVEDTICRKEPCQKSVCAWLLYQNYRTMLLFSQKDMPGKTALNSA